MIARATLLGSLIAATACGDVVTPDSIVAGSWTYDAMQETPAPADLDGTVTWRGVSGGTAAFEGTFTVVERLPGGSLHTISGPGAGEILSDSIADFDLSVDGIGRRHIGVLRGDSISGSWAILDASHTASGHFVLRRNQ